MELENFLAIVDGVDCSWLVDRLRLVSILLI
jgi:hypothetical protein